VVSVVAESFTKHGLIFLDVKRAAESIANLI